MSDTVESDRLVLLSNSERAFDAGDAAKSARILRRVRAQTVGAGPAGPPAGLPVQRPATKPTGAGAATGAIDTTHRTELASPSFSLPLLAPTLHATLSSASAGAAVPAAVPIPSAREPSLFLVDHNLGLAHLRAGQTRVAQVYFARALENAQAVCAAVGPAPAAATLQTTSSTATTPRALALSPAVATRTMSLSVSPHPDNGHTGALSHSTSHHHLSSPSGRTSSPVSGAASSGPHLSSFLIAKQIDLFFHVGVTLMRVHDADADVGQDAQVTTDGLRLAVRCLRHCAQLQSVTPVVPTKHNPFFLHLRLAESLIRLGQHTRRMPRGSSPVHPLLHSNPSASVDGEEFSLELAATHLRGAITSVNRAMENSASRTASSEDASADRKQAGAEDAPIAPVSDVTAMRRLRHLATVKLSYVLLALQRPQEALATLTPLLPSISSIATSPDPRPPAAAAATAVTPASAAATSDTLDPALHFQVEMYAVESLVSLRQLDRALQVIHSSVLPAVQAALARTTDSPAVTPLPATLTSDTLHVLSTLIYIALMQRRHDEARRWVHDGLRCAPRDLRLLQLLLFLKSGPSSSSSLDAIWLLQQPIASPPPQPITNDDGPRG